MSNHQCLSRFTLDRGPRCVLIRGHQGTHSDETISWTDNVATDGRKDDGDKLPFNLMPWRALQEVAKVLHFGAVTKGYGANNWQKVRPVSRYFAASLRHLTARVLGERNDPESGLPHLAHAACCILFMLSFDIGHDPEGTLEP